MEERIIRRKTVLEMLGISSATLHRKIKAGEFEAPLRLGANSVGWRLTSVQRYIESLPSTEISMITCRTARKHKLDGGRYVKE